MYKNDLGLSWNELDTDQKVIELAARMYTALELRIRNNGDRFWCLADYAPEYMTDILREVHGDKFPCDFIYEYVNETVNELANIYDINHIDDTLYQIEGYIYNNDLLKWLNYTPDSTDYMESVINDGLIDVNDYQFFSHIMAAQHEQILEIANAVYHTLERYANDPDFDPQPTTTYYNDDMSTVDDNYQLWVEYIIDNSDDFELTEDFITSEQLALLE